MDDAERRRRDDEKLLRRAEEALTEIKVAQGLADPHASVLAALRIRLKGDAGKSLEDMLAAAGDLSPGRGAAPGATPSGKPGTKGLDDLMAEPEPKGSLDDLFAQEPKKPQWPS